MWILSKHFEGFPKDSNFELKVEELPEPKDGGTFFLIFLKRLTNTYFQSVGVYLTESHTEKGTSVVWVCIYNFLVSEVLLEAVFLSVDPYMRWIGSVFKKKKHTLYMNPKCIQNFIFVSPGHSAQFAWRKAMWWLELKWQSKKHTHAQSSLSFFFFVIMYRACPVFTETEPVLHLLSITVSFDSQKAKTHN